MNVDFAMLSCSEIGPPFFGIFFFEVLAACGQCSNQLLETLRIARSLEDNRSKLRGQVQAFQRRPSAWNGAHYSMLPGLHPLQ